MSGNILFSIIPFVNLFLVITLMVLSICALVFFIMLARRGIKLINLHIDEKQTNVNNQISQELTEEVEDEEELVIEEEE